MLTNKLTFRPASHNDANAIAAIYDKIHTQEEQGLVIIGWDRAVYPTLLTAKTAIDQQDMFVAELDGRIIGSARINQEQVPEYADASWEFLADDNEIMVLHTLTVDPDMSGRGYAKEFVRFYESYASKNNCHFLRMDTNVKNSRARAIYQKLGYKEIGVVPCTFNGIVGVQLVCLEKYIE